MIALPTITLLAIDTVHPRSTLAALAESSRWCSFAARILLTDVRRHLGIGSLAAEHGITVIQHTESDATAHLPGITRTFYPDYERAHLTLPLAHMGDSSHVLYMEADAGVVNPEAWNVFWLSYDYIGAPWPSHIDAGFPPCDGRTNAVGNSGFSLRSRKFLQATVDCLAAHPGDPTWIASDSWMCRTMRPWLEERGVEFAPVGVAERFSCENRIYTGQFGFHGASTRTMNGWKWPL